MERGLARRRLARDFRISRAALFDPPVRGVLYLLGAGSCSGSGSVDLGHGTTRIVTSCVVPFTFFTHTRLLLCVSVCTCGGTACCTVTVLSVGVATELRHVRVGTDSKPRRYTLSQVVRPSSCVSRARGPFCACLCTLATVGHSVLRLYRGTVFVLSN